MHSFHRHTDTQNTLKQTENEEKAAINKYIVEGTRHLSTSQYYVLIFFLFTTHRAPSFGGTSTKKKPQNTQNEGKISVQYIVDIVTYN